MTTITIHKRVLTSDTAMTLLEGEIQETNYDEMRSKVLDNAEKSGVDPKDAIWILDSYIGSKYVVTGTSGLRVPQGCGKFVPVNNDQFVLNGEQVRYAALAGDATMLAVLEAMAHRPDAKDFIPEILEANAKLKGDFGATEVAFITDSWAYFTMCSSGATMHYRHSLDSEKTLAFGSGAFAGMSEDEIATLYREGGMEALYTRDATDIEVHANAVAKDPFTNDIRVSVKL